MYKLIVAGARTVSQYSGVYTAINPVIDELAKKGHYDIEIVSGNARGVDYFGEQYAKEYGVDLVIMPANWDKYGKSAGHKRNKKMAKYADGLVAIRHNDSKGTKSMIELANKNQLDVWIFDYNG